MGEAKRRGTREERVAAAMARDADPERRRREEARRIARRRERGAALAMGVAQALGLPERAR